MLEQTILPLKPDNMTPPMLYYKNYLESGIKSYSLIVITSSKSFPVSYFRIYLYYSTVSGITDLIISTSFFKHFNSTSFSNNFIKHYKISFYKRALYLLTSFIIAEN